MTRYNVGWCQQGHDLSIVGVGSDRNCRECRNRRRRERRTIEREVRQLNPEYRGGRGLPVLDFPQGDWLKAAACGGMLDDTMLPDSRDRDAVDFAKMICSSCPVIAECLEWALTVDEQDGILGGTTMEERDEMRRVAT